MTLGEHIQELRNARGLSQTDLAEAMDVSRQSVSKWETGTSTPDLEKLLRLADYFHLSLDQLVKGGTTIVSEVSDPVKQTVPEPSATAMHRTKAQSVGRLFLALSAFAAILFAILFGVWGVLFAVPLLLFGLICLFVDKHPVLKALWVDYIILSLVLHYGTSLNPSNVLLTFRWTAQMNYGILLLSWVWFLAVLALMIGTAAALRDLGWSWTPGQITEFLAGFGLFALGCVLGALNNYGYWMYFLCIYMRLAGLSVLLTDLARWAFSRKQARNG